LQPYGARSPVPRLGAEHAHTLPFSHHAKQ
jgi:hypothetical protein